MTSDPKSLGGYFQLVILAVSPCLPKRRMEDRGHAPAWQTNWGQRWHRAPWTRSGGSWLASPLLCLSAGSPFSQHLSRHLWDTPTHHTHLISEGRKYLQPTQSPNLAPFVGVLWQMTVSRQETPGAVPTFFKLFSLSSLSFLISPTSAGDSGIRWLCFPVQSHIWCSPEVLVEEKATHTLAFSYRSLGPGQLPPSQVP